MNVLDGDRRVVHQDADSQRQTPKSHDIDGLSQGAEENDGSQNGKRNRNSDNQRAAPTSKKQENHDSRKAGRDERLSQNAGNGATDEDGLVSEQPNLKVRRKRRLYSWQKVLDCSDDVQRRRTSDLLNGH